MNPRSFVGDASLATQCAAVNIHFGLIKLAMQITYIFFSSLIAWTRILTYDFDDFPLKPVSCYEVHLNVVFFVFLYQEDGLLVIAL